MPDQIYIGNFAKGLKTNPLPFNIDNDAFPTLFNMYVWRGRAKRKRGTSLFDRLHRQIQSVAVPNFGVTPWQFGPLALIAGEGNLILGPWLTNLNPAYALEANSSIVPGSIDMFILLDEYTDPDLDGVLYKNGVKTTNSFINYNTGRIFIFGGGVGPLTGFFSYYPDLPVLGLEDFVSNQVSSKFPLLIAFDTTYAYQVNQVAEPEFYSVSYYKGTNNPVIWSNFDYAQFWSTNYQSAFWVTNNKPGFHFLDGVAGIGSGSTVITFTFTSNAAPFTTLVIGDKLWFNEWNAPTANITAVTQRNPIILNAVNTFAAGNKITIVGVEGMTQLNTGTFEVTAATGATITLNVNGTDFDDYISGGIATLVFESTINGSTGTVSNVAGKAAGTYQVTFEQAQTVSGTGIVQMLTNSLPGQDGIRWYDGDPTGGTGLPTGTNLGWVNFSPPLTATNVSLNDQVEAKYYLVGALAILPFKDRLLFFGPQIQKSSSATPIQKPLQDTVIWSWNGTPYYNALVPTNSNNSETFDNTAYYVDQVGKGGYQSSGVSQPLITVSTNEDVLIIGFGGIGNKTRFVYTGNDVQPFLFYLINSEYPSCSTFSAISMDRGSIDIGQYGITLTTQQSSDRIDLDIPDSVFQIQAANNGQDRVNAIRDFFREWIYFSYPIKTDDETVGSWKYPAQTFFFNYRDNTWGIFRENFTHHGTFRRGKKNTWATISKKFGTWANWSEPWNAGNSQEEFPSIIAGNPQGYVLIKDQGTSEGTSGYIKNIQDDGNGYVQITSVNHCVNSQGALQGIDGDYLSFGGPTIGLVTRTIDADNFVIDILYQTSATITAATKATQAVLTITFPIAPTDTAFNSFFVGQRVVISGVVGMTQLNGNTYTIMKVTPEGNGLTATITLNVDSSGFTTYVSGGTVTLASVVSYIGIGSYSRLSQPLLSTKQFPFYWEQGRKIRLCVQKYLLENTTRGQVTLNINLSQDPDNIWNFDPVIPQPNVTNSALIYTQLLYTCPESTNLGLTPANTNLQMPTAQGSYQIWHRLNTSLIGDSVQVGITLNDKQMKDLGHATDEIGIHGIQLTVDKASMLS